MGDSIDSRVATVYRSFAESLRSSSMIREKNYFDIVEKLVPDIASRVPLLEPYLENSEEALSLSEGDKAYVLALLGKREEALALAVPSVRGAGKVWRHYGLGEQKLREADLLSTHGSHYAAALIYAAMDDLDHVETEAAHLLAEEKYEAALEIFNQLDREDRINEILATMRNRGVPVPSDYQVDPKDAEVNRQATSFVLSLIQIEDALISQPAENAAPLLGEISQLDMAEEYVRARNFSKAAFAYLTLNSTDAQPKELKAACFMLGRICYKLHTA